jgi:hypothetical protein
MEVTVPTAAMVAARDREGGAAAAEEEEKCQVKAFSMERKG